MLKIGEFSKLSQITVKALRFYEEEGILKPEQIDDETGYRLYSSHQLTDASKILMLRQLGLSISSIKDVINGANIKDVLKNKQVELNEEKENINYRLSIINYLLEERGMLYQVNVKVIPECIVYYSEAVLDNYGDIMSFIPMCGAKCLELNPNLKCENPEYEFLEYLDGERKEKDVRVRHNEAVQEKGFESDFIKFKKLEETKVLSILHKGPYELLPDAYSFIYKFAEDNGYKIKGLSRECYIDGIWNKEDPAEWLTEIQLPIE